MALSFDNSFNCTATLWPKILYVSAVERLLAVLLNFSNHVLPF